MASASPRKRNSRISFQKNFYSDVDVDNMLYAVTVRSPVADGIVTAVTHPNLPDGYTLVTARDVPGSNLIKTQGGLIPVFCEGNISYLGEPIALLTGPDEHELSHLLKEIEFSIDSNSIDKYLENSAEDEARELFSSFITRRIVKAGENAEEIDKVLEESAHRLKHKWYYSLHTPDYGEPNGALCFWKNESLTVYTPTQWLNNLKVILSETLSIKSESINIEKTASTNRGTNSIWFNSIIACQVAVASKKTGKPVKLVYTRGEQEKFLDTMHTISFEHDTAVSDSGEILAMKIEINVDAGFSNPFAQEIIDRLVIASSGCYNPKNLYVCATALRSHNPASSVDIQLIDSASFFAIENQMNLICSECNLTPLEVRIKNTLFNDGVSSKKNKQVIPYILEIEKFAQTLSAFAKVSDFNRKYASYRMDTVNWNTEFSPRNYVSLYNSPMRGIGFACAYEGSGYFGSKVYVAEQSLEITMESENSVIVHCPPVSKSIQDIWTKIASECLEVSSLSLKIDSVFKSGEEPPLPENVYSNVSIMTDLLKKCCSLLKKKKIQGQFPVSVKKKIAASRKKEWDPATFSGRPFHSTSFIAAIVELEINPCTYREQLRSISILVNGGKILNVAAATSTIKLSIQKVLSSLVDDERIDCSKIKISFMQSENDPTQIGELVYNVIPSAYIQAMNQALNLTMNYLPQRSDSIYNLIKEQKTVLKMKKDESLKNVAPEKKEENQNENTADTEQ